MTARVCVFGLWHLGSVTAACLADQGAHVVGLDSSESVVSDLQVGRPPVAEPGLTDLLERGIGTGRLRFTHDAREALAEADVLWVAFDTPVDDHDRADTAWVRAQLEGVRSAVRANTLIIMSSQVHVGFTRALEDDWQAVDPSLRFVSVPENLRLGQAIARFQQPERVVVGLGRHVCQEQLHEFLEPMHTNVEWMSIESAEMSKHALNSFLALSATYANELARVCERVGADAFEVERALRADSRVGRAAYVSPGGPVTGGTLARDVAFLELLARGFDVEVPVLGAIRASTLAQQQWTRMRVDRCLQGVSGPRVALLGLTYKPDTDTLRRSASVELGLTLARDGIDVTAFDPAIRVLPPEAQAIQLVSSARSALDGADVAVLMTAWPEFKQLQPSDLVTHMRRPQIVDEPGFLRHLAGAAGVRYTCLGYATQTLNSLG